MNNRGEYIHPNYTKRQALMAWLQDNGLGNLVLGVQIKNVRYLVYVQTGALVTLRYIPHTRQYESDYPTDRVIGMLNERIKKSDYAAFSSLEDAQREADTSSD